MSLGSAMGEMLHSYCLRIGVDLEHLDAGERKKLDECLAVGVDYIKAQDKELADRRACEGSARLTNAFAENADASTANATKPNFISSLPHCQLFWGASKTGAGGGE